MKRIIQRPALLCLIMLTALLCLQAALSEEPAPDTRIAVIESRFSCGCEGQAAGTMVSRCGMVAPAGALYCREHGKPYDRIIFRFGSAADTGAAITYERDFTFRAYDNFAKTYSFIDDIAYIKFPVTIGDRTGWYACGGIADKVLKEAQFTVLDPEKEPEPDGRTVTAAVLGEKTLQWNREEERDRYTYGSPVFFTREDGTPVLIGVVCGDNRDRTASRRLNAKMIGAMNKAGLFDAEPKADFAVDRTEIVLSDYRGQEITVRWPGSDLSDIVLTPSGDECFFMEQRTDDTGALIVRILPLRPGRARLTITDRPRKKKAAVSITVEDSAVADPFRLLISSFDLTGDSRGLYCDIKFFNLNDQAVNSFSFAVESYDGQGNRQVCVTDEGDPASIWLNMPGKAIRAGKTWQVSRSYLSGTSGCEAPDRNRSRIAIAGYTLADGTEVVIPEKDYWWFNAAGGYEPRPTPESIYQPPGPETGAAAKALTPGYHSYGLIAGAAERCGSPYAGEAVSAVEERSLADKIGLQRGDIVFKVDGNLWSEEPRMVSYGLARLAQGQEVTFRFYRAGREHAVTAVKDGNDFRITGKESSGDARNDTAGKQETAPGPEPTEKDTEENAAEAQWEEGDISIPKEEGETPDGRIAHLYCVFECGCERECAGTMVGPKGMLVTSTALYCAGHGTPVRSIRFRFGMRPDGSCLWKYDGAYQWKAYTEFRNGFDSDNNIGYIVFPSSIGNITGWYDCSAAADKQLKNKTALVIAPDKSWEMRHMKCEIGIRSDRTLCIPEISESFPGAPMFLAREGEGPLLIAVCSGNNTERQEDSYRRITRKVYGEMKETGILSLGK